MENSPRNIRGYTDTFYSVELQNVAVHAVADGGGGMETAVETRVNGVMPSLSDDVQLQTPKFSLSSSGEKSFSKSAPDTQTSKQGLQP